MGTACPKRVILTRSREDIERDRALFEKLGFEVVPLPMIKTEPLEFRLPTEDFHFVVFQSKKAVRFFLEKTELPPGVRIVAVGEKTRREVESFGYSVWMVPSDESARGLVNEFPPARGETVLVPRSEQGREEVIEGLRGKGYRVIPLNVYRTVNIEYPPEEMESALRKGGFVVFASPSAVKGFFVNLQKRGLKSLPKNLIVVAIGKTTKKELEKFGITPNIVPMKPLIEELTGKIHEYWQENCLR